MFSLSVVLAFVLLNCSQLVSADSVTTCMNSELHLRCDAGVIFVKSVTLGVQSTRNCGPPKPKNGVHVMCFAIPVPAVAKWCNGRAECVVNKEKVAGNDPCFDPYTYYITTYTCVQAKTSVTCEGKQSNLKCDHGRIKIIYANYGHTDDIICLERRPNEQRLHTNCFSPNTLDLVSKRCEGKSQCTVSASNDVFSDPCKGTHKNLWISYYCSY